VQAGVLSLLKLLGINITPIALSRKYRFTPKKFMAVVGFMDAEKYW
jgi:hypothetical protein